VRASNCDSHSSPNAITFFFPHLETSAAKSTSRCGGISVKLVSVKAAVGGLGAALTAAAMFFCVRLLM
jgi:hypothetical protein